MDIVSAFGWSRCLRLSNGDVELIATLDVGPRILSYRRSDGRNVLKEFADQLGGINEPEWMIRGGHRLWIAPEHPTSTYFADNAPVDVSEPEPGVYRLTPPPESAIGIQKEIDIRLDPSGTGVTLVHRIRNVGWSTRNLAAWALTVLAPGGTEFIPLPANRPHPGHPKNARSSAEYAPNQTIIAWPFFDFTDPRWRFGRSYLTLSQDPSRGPTKLGLGHEGTGIGYLNAGTLFVKRFPSPESLRTYPDRGCNFETFTNEDMLEMETLGPIESVPPGEAVELSERWELFHKISPFDATDEVAIEANLGRYLRRF